MPHSRLDVGLRPRRVRFNMPCLSLSLHGPGQTCTLASLPALPRTTLMSMRF